jgi:phytanoyl-CoA hydroxylase
MENGYPKFTLIKKLTDEQIDFFNKWGFIHFSGFLQQESVDAIIRASIEVQNNWIANDVKKINGVPIKYGRDLNGELIVQRFAFISQHHPVLSALLLDPRFTSILQLLGADARIGENEKDGMVLNHYINSPGSKFTRMGWHTDGLRDLFLGQKLSRMLNVGVHLSNLEPENGGLRLIPGTHRQSLYKMLFRKKYFLDNSPDPEEIAILPKAGDLTIHDGRLWHRVAQSTVVGESSRRRVIYIPFIAGKYAPKHENSATPVYQRLSGVVK